MKNFVLTIIICLATVFSVSIINAYGDEQMNLLLIVGYLGLGIVAIGLILSKPYWGLITIVIISPVEAFWPEIPGFSSIASVLGLATLFSYIWNRKNRQLHIGKLLPQFAWAGAFIVWLLFAHPQYILNSRTLTFVQLFILLVLASEMMYTQQQKRMLWIFVAVNLVTIFFAYSQILNTPNFVRAEGALGNANLFAFYLTITFIFNLVLLYLPSRVPSLIFVIVFVLIAVGVVISASRGGIIQFLVASILGFLIWPWVLRSDKTNPRQLRVTIVTLLLVSSLIILVLFFVPEGYVKSWSYRFSALESDSSVLIRLTLLEDAIRMWSDNPIFGIGIGQFGRYVSLDRQLTAHNIYISVLAETGSVGFILFMGLLITTVRDLYRALKIATGEDKVLILGWLTLMLTLLVAGISEGSLQYNKLLWIIMGISAAYRQVYLSDSTQNHILFVDTPTRTKNE